MKYFFIVILVVIALLFLCAYFFVRKILAAFGADIKKKRIKLLCAVITAVISAAVMFAGGFGAIIILHIAAFELLLMLANFVLKKSCGDKAQNGFSVWKKLYSFSVIPIVLTVAVMLIGYVNMNTVTETKYTVYTEKDIRDEGYRIALIADVHYGISLDKEGLYEKCREISSKNVDAVILCGDIVDNSTTPEGMREVFEALGTIRSKYGIYYVFGNHDRSMRLMESDFSDTDLVDTIKSNGITILEDDVVNITDEFVIAGRADKSRGNHGGEGRIPIAELLSGADREDFILTLDHQPSEYSENGDAGTDLLLSGHTHAGQFFPVNFLMEIIPFNDGVYGHYKIDSDTDAIITSGFAAWGYPVKTAAPSEYVIIDINHKG